MTFYSHTPAPFSEYCAPKCPGCRAKRRDRMAYFDKAEAQRRKATRPAAPGNNRATVRETVRLLEARWLVVDRDLVI